ncbi:MAG: hypothetical protein ABI325_06970 [Ginsengibacter sp.]
MLAFEKVWNQRPDAPGAMVGDGGKLFEQSKHLTIQLKMNEVVSFMYAWP